MVELKFQVPPVTFSSTTVLNPTVSLGSYDIYTFELRGDDTWQTATDTVVIRKNARPTANAGSDRSVVKNSDYDFDGSGSDDPDHFPNATLSYRWILVSGDVNKVTLSNDRVISPTVSISSAGTYTFRY